MHQLLEACGDLKEWKPAIDPASGDIKGFGFATYKQPEGVLIALSVLNGFSLDGQALALKCNSATDQYIQWYKTSQGGEVGMAAKLQPAVDEAKAKIAELTGGRAPVAQAEDDAANAANAFLSSFGQEGGATSQPTVISEPAR